MQLNFRGHWQWACTELWDVMSVGMSRALLGKKRLYDITLPRSWQVAPATGRDIILLGMVTVWCDAEIDDFWPGDKTSPRIFHNLSTYWPTWHIQLLWLCGLSCRYWSKDPEKDQTSRYGAKMSDNTNHCQKSWSICKQASKHLRFCRCDFAEN